MLFEPDNLDLRERYKLMIGTVLPRPIAWVSTMDAEGRLNLAPFSYFTGVCNEPLTLMFCPVVPATQGSKKDTLRNIEETGEFVINMTDEHTAEAMNLSATALPHGESEFEWANVTPEPSHAITVPRVKEAPVAFECVLQTIVHVSDRPGGGSAVFGEVKAVHVRDDLYAGGRIDLAAYRPIGRLGGNGYTRIENTFEMKRVPPPERAET